MLRDTAYKRNLKHINYGFPNLRWLESFRPSAMNETRTRRDGAISDAERILQTVNRHGAGRIAKTSYCTANAFGATY